MLDLLQIRECCVSIIVLSVPKRDNKWLKHTTFFVAFFEYWNKSIFLQLKYNQLIMAVKAIIETYLPVKLKKHKLTKLFDAMYLFLLFGFNVLPVENSAYFTNLFRHCDLSYTILRIHPALVQLEIQLGNLQFLLHEKTHQ